MFARCMVNRGEIVVWPRWGANRVKKQNFLFDDHRATRHSYVPSPVSTSIFRVLQQSTRTAPPRRCVPSGGPLCAALSVAHFLVRFTPRALARDPAAFRFETLRHGRSGPCPQGPCDGCLEDAAAIRAGVG